MREAYKTSSRWYFRDLARRVGADTMEKIIRGIDCYGNMNYMGELDKFWVDGSLMLSVDEQVEFLRRLYSGELSFRKGAIDTLFELMTEIKTADATLMAKTGTFFEVNSEKNVAWYVGIAEKGNRTAVFAMNMALPLDTLTSEFLDKRKEITKQILKSQALID